jgi:hypothetical protein
MGEFIQHLGNVLVSKSKLKPSFSEMVLAFGRVSVKTKRNPLKQTKTNQKETKPNETKPNETKLQNKIKIKLLSFRFHRADISPS